MGSVDWESISPNIHGDWISARSEVFAGFHAIGDKKNPSNSVFARYSSGLKTGRDAWCYNFSRVNLAAETESMIDYYNEHVRRATTRDGSRPQAAAELGTTQFSWNRGSLQDFAKRKVYSYADSRIYVATYRPFIKQWCYFDRQVNDMVYRMPSMFPTAIHTNLGFYVVGAGSDKPFSAIMTDTVPDLAFWGSSNGQYFPRWTYGSDSDLAIADNDAELVDGFTRVDNITDSALRSFNEQVGEPVTKDDIFFYVYALLHSPAYRETFTADLKKMLPRVPLPTSKPQFRVLVDAGRQLAELHVGYESVEPYPLQELETGTLLDATDDRWRLTKMRWKSKTDHSSIVYNTHLTLAGIPEKAHEYRLGSRTALEWLIDRYQVSTDKKSGIVNNPNDWGAEHDDPRYVVDLIKRITTVSVKTVEIVENLPDLQLG